MYMSYNNNDNKQIIMIIMIITIMIMMIFMFSGESLVWHCLSGAGFLQRWRTMPQITMILGTTNNTQKR